MAVKSVHLPKECWELIIEFLGDGRYLESASSVCKQFLSITNPLQSSLTILDPTISVRDSLFKRFPRLKSLDFSRFHGDLEGILGRISTSRWDLHELNLSNQRSLPVNGLRVLGSKTRNLRVLNCSNMKYLYDSDLIAIAQIFPSLEELDISFPENHQRPVSDEGVLQLSSKLKHLRKINLSGNLFITDNSLLSLCKSCELLKEMSIFDCNSISQIGIACAIRQRPNLTSISMNNIGNVAIQRRTVIDSDFIGSLVSVKGLTAINLSNSWISDELLCFIAEECLLLNKLILEGCSNFTFAGISYLLSKCQAIQCLDLQKCDFLLDQNISELSMFLGSVTSINLSGCKHLTDSTFFTLTRNCPSLTEIKLERTERLKDNSIGNSSSMDFVVNPEVKSLNLGHGMRLDDESIKRFASVCPNLKLLDLSNCWGISGECVVEILKRCPKIGHLSLAGCAGLKFFEIDSLVPNLEVLKLSESIIGDKALSIIGKNCGNLQLLDIQKCRHVTAKGVSQLVKNCKGLKEINLKKCEDVHADIVDWMLHSRPSLKRVTGPRSFVIDENQSKLYMRQYGCLVYKGDY